MNCGGHGGSVGTGRAILRLGAEDLEVVAVVRGGGAAASLAAFDAEAVARAIARCSVPVVMAVGRRLVPQGRALVGLAVAAILVVVLVLLVAGR